MMYLVASSSQASRLSTGNALASTSRRGRSAAGAASARVMAVKQQENKEACGLHEKLGASVLAVAMTASLILGPGVPSARADAALTPSERRAQMAERRRQLLADARAKAESQAESINEEGGQADTETEAPVPEPEAPRAPATSSEDLKAMLREYQATNTPSAVPTPALAPKPAPEPQDPPKRVFSFSKPAAPEPEVEDPAKEEPKAAEPFKPAYRFSVPKPAAPEPRHEAPQEEALKPAFSSFMPASPPAPGTAAPAPKPAAPAPTPSPAPATVIKPKAEVKKAPEAPAPKPNKDGKRKGPLPLFAAQFLMTGIFAAAGIAGTKYSSETAAATKAAGKFLAKTLTKAEQAMKGK